MCILAFAIYSVAITENYLQYLSSKRSKCGSILRLCFGQVVSFQNLLCPLKKYKRFECIELQFQLACCSFIQVLIFLLKAFFFTFFYFFQYSRALCMCDKKLRQSKVDFYRMLLIERMKVAAEFSDQASF